MFEKSIQTLSFFIISIVTIVLGIFFEKLQTIIPIPLWTLILFGLLIVYMTLITLKTERKNKDLNENINLSEKSSMSKKTITQTIKNTRPTPKRLPDKVPIKTIHSKSNFEYLEWDIYVRRCWYPTDKPIVQEFCGEISISYPVCKECKTQYTRVKKSYDNRYLCNGNNCSLRYLLIKDDISINISDINGKTELLQYKGEIRKDGNLFDILWIEYRLWYLKITKRKINDYQRPLSLSR